MYDTSGRLTRSIQIALVTLGLNTYVGKDYTNQDNPQILLQDKGVLTGNLYCGITLDLNMRN